MNLDLLVITSNLASLFCLIAVGFAAVRSGLFSPEASAPFSALLLRITLPCTIFISLVQREYDPAFIRDSLVIIALGLVAFPAMLYASRLIAPALGVPGGRRGIWAFCCAFSNAGFMGFPIALTLFGPEGLALAVMLNITFNIYVYTIGAMEIARDNDAGAAPLNWRSVLLSNINIALVLSLVFYFGRVPLPDVLAMPLRFLSDITTPLSMIITGMALGKSRGRELFMDRDAYTSAAMRLAVLPLVLYALFRLLPVENPLVVAVAVVIFAMPAPSITTVLTEMYHGNMELAARSLFLHNILCVATIPLICLLFS
ncbi:MAG: AEC family transporter [Fretibacterium sp.]|nr:AEC family transporter [Fretibacterium sp.]